MKYLLQTSSTRCLSSSRRRCAQLATRNYAAVAHPNANYVKIVEVGARDGLQNEPVAIPPEVKVELINRLGRAGLKVIEAGSFVSPKWVPQMGGTAEVISKMEHLPGRHYPVLVPNMKGLEDLLSLLSKQPSSAPRLTDEIAVFSSATDSFSKANTNCTVAESLERLEKVSTRALAEGLRVRGYVSVVIRCPFEGQVDPRKVKAVSRALLDMGCYEVSLGDTVGMGTPTTVRTMLETVMGGDRGLDPSQLAAHFHDTYGTGVANVLAALDMGLRTVDSAVAGLGGCPYSPGATGNVATEDIIYALQGSQYDVSGDLDAIADVGTWISKILKRENESRAGRAIRARKEKECIVKERERDGGAAEKLASES